MKKTIKKRAFVSAIAMLIVSAIVLTSSTFAWFSMSKVAEVEEMTLNVSSPEGIQISANASTWTSSLTQDEIFNPDSTSRHKAYDGNINLLPGELVPASCRLYEFDSNGNALFYRVSLNDSKRATASFVSQAAGGADTASIVAFDLFFKVAADTVVYFNESEFIDESGAKTLTALRLGFQFLGNTDSSNATDAIALKSTSNKTGIIYEPDSQKRSDDAAGLGEGYITTNYIGSINANNSLANDNYVLTSATGAPACSVIKDTDSADSKMFTLKAGVNKVRVYIWLEGQDVDCQNSVAGSQLTAALKFTIK